MAKRQSRVLQINIDWFELYGWKCPFCGGDIDHLTGESDEENKWTDDSYTCQDKGGDLCEHAYMMVRWSHKLRGDNRDALTLVRWIDLEIKDEGHPDEIAREIHQEHGIIGKPSDEHA